MRDLGRRGKAFWWGSGCRGRGGADELGQVGRGDDEAHFVAVHFVVAGVDADDFAGGVEHGRAAGPGGVDGVVVELDDDPTGDAGHFAGLQNLPGGDAAADVCDDPDGRADGGELLGQRERRPLERAVVQAVEGHVVDGRSAIGLEVFRPGKQAGDVERVTAAGEGMEVNALDEVGDVLGGRLLFESAVGTEQVARAGEVTLRAVLQPDETGRAGSLPSGLGDEFGPADEVVRPGGWAARRGGSGRLGCRDGRNFRRGRGSNRRCWGRCRCRQWCGGRGDGDGGGIDFEDAVGAVGECGHDDGFGSGEPHDVDGGAGLEMNVIGRADGEVARERSFLLHGAGRGDAKDGEDKGEENTRVHGGE